jgi:hypothetical protein
MVTKHTGLPVKEVVLCEFPPIGKYRIRLLANPKKPQAEPVLDIREYATSETFEGFTRRGVRLTNRNQVDLLCDVLREVRHALTRGAEVKT